MLPMPMLAVGAGALGYGIYKYFNPSKPVLQSLRSIAPGSGVPVQVVVPVTPAPVASGKAVVPIPPNNTGTGASYAPAPVIVQDTPGQLKLGPTVITPSGASSLSVQTNGDVQMALNTLGYASPPLVIDQKVGPLTSAAIRKFQVKYPPIDGKVTPVLKGNLQTALGDLAGTGSSIGQSPVVQQADFSSLSGVLSTIAAFNSGTLENVKNTPTPVSTNKDVQHALNLLGASPALVEDGVLGPKTNAAIKAFQISHGLVADGVAGPKTKTAISIALNPPVTPATMTGEPHHHRHGKGKMSSHGFGSE
jgi:peptidoglycan hydrolase-like protein with peptidoglycan-binding domain